MNIIISNEARKDIEEIFTYIASDSLFYAKKTTQNIRSSIYILKHSPYIGRYLPELNTKHLRELLYKSYRIIYKISESKNKIYILSILHSKRNISPFLSSYIKDPFNF